MNVETLFTLPNITMESTCAKGCTNIPSFVKCILFCKSQFLGKHYLGW